MINRERTDTGDSLNRTNAPFRPGGVPLTSANRRSKANPSASRERDA